MTTALFRGIGIGLCAFTAVWTIALSIAFIVDDAKHLKAHLWGGRSGVPWPGFVIAISVILFVLSVIVSLFVESENAT